MRNIEMHSISTHLLTVRILYLEIDSKNACIDWFYLKKIKLLPLHAMVKDGIPWYHISGVDTIEVKK
jgi:hypothetical protein